MDNYINSINGINSIIYEQTEPVSSILRTHPLISSETHTHIVSACLCPRQVKGH